MNAGHNSRAVSIAATFVAIAAAIYVYDLVYEPLVRPILEVIPPFAIALLLALLLDPVVDWLQRRKLSRGLGVAIVGVGFLVVFVVIGFTVLPKVAEQAGQLAENSPQYATDAQEQIGRLLDRYKPYLERLNLPTTLDDWGARFSSQIRAAVGAAAEYLAGSLAAMLSRALWVIIIPIATLFLLKDLDYLRWKVRELTPEAHRERLGRFGAAVGEVFGNYVRGMLTVALLFSVLASTILTVAGLQYGLIIGVVSGVFYLVPYIGVAVLALGIGIAALIQPPHGTGYALTLVLIIVGQSMILFDQVITPRVVGRSVGVHPVLTLFALALGARMFGVVGMIFAVPTAAVLQVAIGQCFPDIYAKPVSTRAEPPAEG